MLTISDCQSLGFTASDLQNLRRRYPDALRTTYEPTTAGRAQALSAENAFELVLVRALMKCNVSGNNVGRLADGFVQAFRKRKQSLHRFPEHIVFAAGRDGEPNVGAEGATLKDISNDAMTEIAQQLGAALSVVCTGKIKRDVEALFGD